MTEPHTAVVDRIVDGRAVIVFDDDSQPEESTVDVATLPEAARHEGAVLGITLSDGTVADTEYRPEAERGRRDRAQERFDRLSERLGEE